MVTTAADTPAPSRDEPIFDVTPRAYDTRLTWAWSFYTAAAVLAVVAQPLVSSAAWGLGFNVTERVTGLTAVAAWVGFILRGRENSLRVRSIAHPVALVCGMVLLLSTAGQFLSGMVRPGP